MAVSAKPHPTAPPAPDAGATLHNPVLTRTHEPARSGSHSWIMLVPLGVAIVAGAIFWVYVQTHPTPPLVNHAVGSAPRAAFYSSTGN